MISKNLLKFSRSLARIPLREYDINELETYGCFSRLFITKDLINFCPMRGSRQSRL